MERKLSASEAVYAFCAWLTTRKEKTIMSSSDDSGAIATLVDKFCNANELDDPKSGWESCIRFPQ